MLSAEQIKEKLEQTAQAKITIRPVEHLSASRLGHPCERYLYLLLTHWEDVKLHDVGLQHIFDLGNSVETYAIDRIKEAGFEVITPVSGKGGNFRIEVKNGVVTGREDLRIKDSETGELLPVEIKGLSQFEFDKLNSIDDFFKSKRAHVRGYPTQLFVYMYKFEKERGFFVIVNKQTGELKIIEVHLDYEFGEQCLAKAERIYDAVANNTPPDSCDDVSLCENCNLQHICGKVKRIPADIEVDGELDELIKRKYELSVAKKEYEEVDKQIKDKVGEREKVITGEYLITRSTIEKKEYTVPARTEHRLTIKKL